MLLRERSYMHRLLEEKLPIAEVARRVGRSRQTIYNWLRQEEDELVPARRASKLDPHRGYIESRLERYDLPATVLLEEIRARGYTGGITILRDLVATIKQRHVRRVVDRFETEPGRQAQMDWASCGTIWHRGRRRRLSLFALVLGYSRVIWARFVISEKRPVLMELLEEAFSELGGVPRELLVDNLKQVIAVVRSGDTSAVVQTEFADFAEHWGFEVVACPPYWPRAKGKVERAIQYIKTSFLEGRSFTDLEDLNAQLRVWLAEAANVRLHGTTRMRPVDRLAFDLERMRSVEGLSGYPRALAGVRQADHDGWISYGGVRYSTDPHILGARRGTEVAVEVSTRGELFIRHQGRLVGRHRLQRSGSPPQDDSAHAAARRQLRQRPPESRPRPKAPRFEQRFPEAMEALVAQAPLVEARALAAYEGVH
jgi:transposase